MAQTTLINALFSRKTQNTAGHTPRYTCECTEQFQPANVKKEPKRQLQLCMLKNNKTESLPFIYPKTVGFVFYSGICIKVCSPGRSAVKNPLAKIETEVRSLVGENSEKKMAAYSSVLAWEEGRAHGHLMDRRTWPGTVHGVAKGWDTAERRNNKCVKVGGGIISVFFF